MNIIKSIKQAISNKSFKNKASIALEKIYTQEPNDLLIHNNGQIVREGGDLFQIKNETVDGIYLRRMLLNKGTVIISAIHKRDHVWFLLEGDITVTSFDGIKNYSAPYVGFSKAGTQRVIYANEMSIFQNVFKNPNDITDLDELEKYNYCTTKEQYKEYKKNK